MPLDLSSLEDAIAQLEEGLELYDSEVIESDPRLKKHMRAAVIQAFEFTYELCFKMLKRHLKLASANPDEFDTMFFNDVIREAYKQGLLKSELAIWREYRRERGTTSHGYSATKAQEVFECVPDFIAEARYLLKRLLERNDSIV